MAEHSLAQAALRVPLTLGRPTLDDAQRLRLAELGLRPGVVVVALQRTPGGGRVVQVGHCRYVLDHLTCTQLPVIVVADG